jgi:superoxide dismutase, Cu-Zn family
MGGMSMPGSTVPHSEMSGGDVVALAQLATPQGQQVGTVRFAVSGSVVTVSAAVQGLPAGFKGFHIHAIGKCEPNSANPTDPSKVGDFLSAGGHLGSAAAAHPGHQGDLTALEVRTDGSAELVTSTDAFDMESVLDADGSAVMVHSGPDNFGNIPTRYAPTGPDADTQATGDSGGRAACGAVTADNG